MVHLKILILMYTYIQIYKCNVQDMLRGKIERVELVNFDKSYGDGNVSTSKFNRTSIGVSVYAELYKEFSNEVFIDLLLYAEFSNEYRRMPYQFEHLPFCYMLSTIAYFIEEHINKVGYFPSSCPIKKGKYSVKNYVLHNKVLPNFPWNKVMYEVNLTAYDKVRLTVRCYITMDHDSDMINKAIGIL